ncbi:MAG: hypothetical protein ACOH5I_07825 [Oligoflexus sp.]
MSHFKPLCSMICLFFLTQAQAKDLSVSAYTELPISDGIEVRGSIARTPIEFKLKFGQLNVNYIRGASDYFLDKGLLELSDAIVFDGAYQEGYHIGFAIGSKIPKISPNLYFDFGYAFIAGDGSISAEETAGILPPGLLQGLAARGLVIPPSDLEMGLRGRIETLTANIGYKYHFNKFLALKADMTLNHALSTSMKTEFGPQVLKTILEDKLNDQQGEAFKQIPVLPSISIALSYSVGG